MRTSDIIITSVEGIFYLFHLSLLIVLICERKNKFSGAFFNMLRLLFLSDIVFFITSFVARVPAYGFWRNFFESDTIMAKFEITVVAYLLSVQFCIHSLIPFNRFTLFWFPAAYRRIWERQWYTVASLILPIFMQIPWLLEPASFVYSKMGTVVLNYVNAIASDTSSYMLFICSFIMTLCAAIFNLLAIIKHFIHKFTSPDLIQLKEITFLYMSCFMFFIHCLYCFTLFGRAVINNQIIEFLLQALSVFINDIIAWSGSLSLLIISKYARKTYIDFYRSFKRKKSPVSIKVSAASRTQVTQVSRMYSGV